MRQEPVEHICVGCGGPIRPGTEALVTVQSAKHMITVHAHDDHRAAAYAVTMERTDWKRDPSFYAG
jgi:hypothetical protein